MNNLNNHIDIKFSHCFGDMIRIVCKSKILQFSYIYINLQIRIMFQFKLKLDVRIIRAYLLYLSYKYC